jgi:putative hydrolase of HD superfamily
VDSNSRAERILEFLTAIEPMKSHVRSAWTAIGREESVAAHSWRLCMLALAVGSHLPDLDTDRLIRICMVHDLGEAISGDTPAPIQDDSDEKRATEQATVESICATLGAGGEELVALWREYDEGTTREAIVAKALDKIETIAQHNQGANPPDFDYGFNMEYGTSIPITDDVVRVLRDLVDRKTAELASKNDPTSE